MVHQGNHWTTIWVAAAKAEREEKEKRKIERIMQKYKETLEALPGRAVLMYTDGGYQYVEPEGRARSLARPKR